MEISDGISIEYYAMMNAQNQVMQKVDTALLSKTLDLQEAQGAQLTKMMELSVNPNLGSQIDVQV